MDKWKRIWRSFYKNVIKKKKFKSYLQSFIDSEYRAQINNLYEITKDCTHTELEQVPAWQIELGHKIIYPKYEQLLLMDESMPIDPIKVVQRDMSFIVVDGNHRLKALKYRAKRYGEQTILCEVMK